MEGEVNNVNNTVIERAKLKGYIPTFTVTVENESATAVTNTNVAQGIPDRELLPLIKLLHAVYVQEVA